jgi:Cu+-exporting ATPase
MFVEEKPESLQVSLRGTTFYFCSSTCLLTFTAPARELARLKWMTVLSFALGIPILALTWFISLPQYVPQGVVLLLLATPVQLIAGGPFYRGAWHAARARVPNMDTLIAIGTTTAWGYSVLVTLLPGAFPRGTYFDVSSLIIGFILLGKLLEYSMRGRASQAVRKLLDQSPKLAVVVNGETETEVPVEEVKVGDLFRVRPGDRIPTDGEVVDGSGTLDEKMLTGESLPVDKKVGDEVFGGTLDKTGLLTVRATKVGSDTTLAQIVRLVEDAQAAQAPVQRLADRVAAYFVPLVVLVAIGAFALWFLSGAGLQRGFLAFVAVLIVACPCALGLATPAAIFVGTARGAAGGILIKGGDTLEKASKVDAVVFDKTGTLTVGEPAVTDVATIGGLAEEEVLGLAASAEVGSEHPLGQALVKAARATGLRVERPSGFEAFPGLGVRATVGKRSVVVGSAGLAASQGIDVHYADDMISELQQGGKTTMVVSVDGKAEGVVAVADTLKSDAKDAVDSLRRDGMRVVMLTGDNQRTAKSIGAQVGIADVLAGLLPAQKSEAIRSLRKEGRVVAMVGDGINDAPALAEADLGIAIGSGTDVAVETAGLVLIRDRLVDVVGAIRLSRATMRKIRQNLFWAFGYNIILIPLAASGYMNPILAGVAMALSSVSVVGNSLSLNRVKLGAPEHARPGVGTEPPST